MLISSHSELGGYRPFNELTFETNVSRIIIMLTSIMNKREKQIVVSEVIMLFVGDKTL